jgi:hypothetical protein
VSASAKRAARWNAFKKCPLDAFDDDELQYAEDPQHTKKQKKKKKKKPKNMQLQLQSPPVPADPRQAIRFSSSHCINKAEPIAKPVDPPIGLVTVMDGCMSPITPDDMCLSPITPDDEVAL